MSQPAELQLPGVVASLPALCSFARQAALAAGLSARTAWEIELAVDEAATNIIQHAYAGELSGDIRLVCSREANHFKLALYDQGRAFDRSQVPPPDLTSPIATREAGGLGIYLMGQMMDEIHFNANPQSKENELVLVKYMTNDIPEHVRVVVIEGRIDANAAPAVATLVRNAASAGGQRILLDLSGVTFLSSSGLRILLLLARELRSGNGELRLCAMQPAVAEVFAITGFTQIFTIHRSRDEGLAAMSAPN